MVLIPDDLLYILRFEAKYYDTKSNGGPCQPVCEWPAFKPNWDALVFRCVSCVLLTHLKTLSMHEGDITVHTYKSCQILRHFRSIG
jgi:hypothetical protein